ncbi:methyl-accepting chemotaxis protein [Roseobacter sinensis]|uniref:Methyl-accepting chemotaxis protein n=1 Tax=Roseobacter sinensis TaxID=2931391 RepID=A0ABT3BJV6_9RHOB|nr:methyl-accepting chemotaxis protein [Roseobacter sp. WL0113]MCV3273639.1 methyl-accepting chemotaxis protein [Roseobacter sp. WL0113]
MDKSETGSKKKVIKRWRMPDSIYLKCLIALAVSTALTIGLVTYKSIKATETIAAGSILKLGGEVVSQLGERAAPALRFRKTEDIDAVLRATLDGLEGSVSGALVLAADGEVVAEQMLEGFSSADLRQTAERALQEGVLLQNPERLIVAAPVKFGQNAEIIGVIALDWRTDVLGALVIEQKKTSVLLAAGVGLLMLLIVGFMIKRMVARPLLAIAGSMREVADGNYQVEIPKYRRGNEIGIVARALEQFRDQLHGSEQARKDAAMKSTALDAGSAAIMIADQDFNIVYASRAVLNLLREHSDVISSRISGFDPDAIVGQSIDIFHKRAEMQRRMLEALGPEGHNANLEMDDITLELKISRIDGEDGERIGYVVEWADVSQQRLNSAVLKSLDSNQARAEFGHDGGLVDANAAFRTLAGLSDETETCNFADVVFVGNMPADPKEPMFSEFEIRTKAGTSSYALGGLSPVFYSNGDLKRTVLIAADVTEERRQKAAATEERERLQMEQDAMIDALSGALSVLAEGDLAVRITTAFAGANDKIRQDFNVAVERLEEAITSVISSATTMRSEVEGVASAAAELSKRTESQAATLEETAAAISEISASVTSSAEGARDAHSVVGAAQDNAQTSGGVVRDAVSAMGKIASSSSEITSIVKVIDDIAFQTNLLALNAGVEAARAGDAGRGFAVVASEVRALAQRSSDAANEISSLIATSSENVDLGVKLVGDAGDALEQIIASISDISGYVSQIAGASEEQSHSIAEINSAMSQLDQVTQENAAMFEETTAASQSLSQIANELTDRVQRFSSKKSESGPVQAGQMLQADTRSIA